MPLATFHAERTADALILHVIGEIDLSNADELHAHVKQLHTTNEPAPTTTRVDLTEVTYFDSAGINTLFALNKELTSTGHSLQVIAPQGNPARRALDVVQFNQVVTVSET